jgi:hypothetical protein
MKEEIKTLINLVRKFHSEFKIHYIPLKTIYSAEKLYDLYYGGAYTIIISSKCVSYYKTDDWHRVDITNSNIDKIADRIYNLLSDNVQDDIVKAIENLGKEGEILKYFDRDKKLFKKFQAEVLRLKDAKQNVE